MTSPFRQHNFAIPESAGSIVSKLERAGGFAAPEWHLFFRAASRGLDLFARVSDGKRGLLGWQPVSVPVESGK
jgi:hypothetical protein